MLEKIIEKTFVEYAKSKGALCLKLVFFTGGGFPDRTLIVNGKIIFIEFKQKGKKLRPLQVVIKKRLESHGCVYHVCDEIGQAEAILDEMVST